MGLSRNEIQDMSGIERQKIQEKYRDWKHRKSARFHLQLCLRADDDENIYLCIAKDGHYAHIRSLTMIEK
jgi:hypothetical protein